MSTPLEQLIQRERAKQTVAQEALIFWGEFEDKSYLPQLRSIVGSYTTLLRFEKVDTLTMVKMYAEKKKCQKILSTSISLLKKLLHWDKRRAPSLKHYAGSHFYIPGTEIEVVFIQPLKQLVTVSYGKFMGKRLASKLIKPDDWYVPTSFTGFEILVPEHESDLFFKFNLADLVSIDIETFKENAVIRCLSYTAFFLSTNGGKHTSTSVVLPMDSPWALATMRKWNWKLQAPKVFQNGKYDNAYLLRYNAPVYRWIYDTAHLFHSWLSELPKDLGFLNSYFIREATYWKDLSETDDTFEYYRYNAMDTWGTGNAFLAMVSECPDWAIENYLLEFPMVYPCLLAEMTGMERDMDALTIARKETEDEIVVLSARLDGILGVKDFNVKSPPQMKQLLTILGNKDLSNANEKSLERARFRHPFSARILGLVLDIRELRTRNEKYLQIGTEAKEFHRYDGTGNRMLFAINPHGTDTSRLASKEHHFWTGWNVQNVTRGTSVKRTIKSDPGFEFAEVDYEQAESRDTAYISGDKNLIQAVEYSPDFHSQNASSFFGIPFEEIFDAATGKVLNKPIRQISKNTNHGANYNMGSGVMVITMGEENVYKAKMLLGLPQAWGYKRVCQHLLDQFHKTYPGIKATFYKGVVKDVKETGLLKHRLVGEPGWTRRCFGDVRQKRYLNVYVAHVPQGLNAQTLNKAYWKVFKKIAINPEHARHFKLGPQIHDSILFQYRIGCEHLIKYVEHCMKIPVTILGYDGVEREFTVPTEAKLCGTHWEQEEEEVEMEVA